MKEFLAAIAVCVVIVVMAIVLIDKVNEPSEEAHQTATGNVRL